MPLSLVKSTSINSCSFIIFSPPEFGFVYRLTTCTLKSTLVLRSMLYVIRFTLIAVCKVSQIIPIKDVLTYLNFPHIVKVPRAKRDANPAERDGKTQESRACLRTGYVFSVRTL